jgi:hypothetical protein
LSLKTKRTYNLSERTVRRVRELAADGNVAPTQDAVVEVAVDQLYDRIRPAEEGRAWEAAASDPAFRAEMDEIAADFGDAEDWPTQPRGR